MSFLSDAFKFISGNSLGASVAKIAILGFTSKLLSKNTDPGENANQSAPDAGVRLQLNPDTENKLPVLYGSAYFGGYITDATLSADYKTMTYCVSLAELTDSGTLTFNNVYINNNRVVFKSDGYTVDYTLDAGGNQDISLRDVVKVYLYADATGGIQPSGYTGATPDSWSVMPNWTELTHPMTGVVFAVVEVKYTRGGNTGVPNCVFHITNSLNQPGSVLSDYMQNTRYGAGIASADINASLAVLDTYCATGFTYTDLASNPQTQAIEFNGLVDTKNTVLDNMTKMSEAANSWLTYDIHQGQWGVVVNQPGASVAGFSDSNIVGEINITGTSLTQLSNIAEVRYQNTDILDNTDFVKITIPEVDLFQNEVPKTLTMSLPYTNKQVTALNIGLQALKQARVDKIITFAADFSYVNLTAGNIIDVTSSVYGFTNKLFRIITAQEQQSDDGGILIQFTCLDYNADVYNYDIAEYAVETDDGILGIGAIGTPNTPTVTKTETSNTPKITINALVPSGIVDALEFWITFDTGVPNDVDRAYVNIGTYSLPNGQLLTEDAVVNFDYSQLGQSDFFVKVRGVNLLVNGPYSDISGLIEYVPVVVADTISNEPVSIGGQLMSLGVLTLLNNLDDLLSLFNGEKGIKDALKDIFFGGSPSDPDLASDLLSADPAFTNNIATSLANDPAFISSVGEATVDIGNYSIDALNDVDTTTVAPTSGDILTWNGTNWVVSAFNAGDSGAVITPVDPPAPPVQKYLYFADRNPIDAATNYEEQTFPVNQSQEAPVTGSYSTVLSVLQQHGGIYNDVTLATGNVKLYKSDGTLVETVAIGDCILHKRRLEIPFADRQPGVNYYILIDEGAVTYCSGEYISVGITSPTSWNFNTPKYHVAPYVMSDVEFATYSFTAPSYNSLTFAASPFGTGVGIAGNLVITFSENVTLSSLTSDDVKLLKDTGGGTVLVQSWAVTDAAFSNNKILDFGAFNTLEYSSDYKIEVNANVVSTARAAVTLAGPCGISSEYTPNNVANTLTTKTFSTGTQFNYSSFSAVNVDGTTETFQDVATQSALTLTFTQPPVAGAANPAEIKLFKTGDVLVQTFNLNASFSGNQISSELFTISGNNIRLNPTEDMSPDTVYYITIGYQAVKNAKDVYITPITDDATITFKTHAGPVLTVTTPTGSSMPNDNGIVMSSTAPIVAGTAKIQIINNATSEVVGETAATGTTVNITNE